jgi:hypothetical protein
MRLTIVRPEDLLVLDFELVNLRLLADGSALVREDPASEAFVVVHFPPQALAEPVWDLGVETPLPPPVRTVLAGPSRLVFRVPPEAHVPLTVAGLLAWESWEPVLAPTALPRPTPPDPAIPPPALPGPLETALELPWRLVLSPDRLGRWRTDDGAEVTAPQQLWSAVLFTAGSEADRTAVGADVRALSEHTGPRPFDTPLDGFAAARRKIVQLSSNFHLPVPAGEFMPVPLWARRLELTALGASFELEAAWNYPRIQAADQPPPGYEAIDLVGYDHTAALGRDHFVRTAVVGYLCPTGHQAVVVETVERLPSLIENVGEASGGGAPFGAKGYLLRTVQAIVQQPVVDYGPPLAHAFAHGGREFPFRSIHITTKSALIKPPAEDDEAFWLKDPDDRLLMFRAVGTDVTGSTVDLSLPLVFVRYESIGKHRDIHAVFQPDPDELPTAQLGGQTVTFAPPGDKPGSTALKTESLTYDMEQPAHDADPHPAYPMNADAAPEWYVPGFLPRIASIRASVPAVDDLLGPSEAHELELDPVYLAHGIDGAQNRAETFARFPKGLALALPTQRGGGLASPASVAQALSRSLGPVSAPAELQLGRVDLSDFADTKLLGTVPLLDLLPAELAFDAAAVGSPPSPEQLADPGFTLNPPRLVTRRSGDVVETRFVWKPPLKPAHAVSPLFTLDLADSDLLLDATTRVVADGEATSVVFGQLREARLTFAGALSAKIGTLLFRGESGRKLEVGAKDVVIRFEGPLEFVNALQSILPSDGFDDPPSLTVDSQGVVAGYTLGVPTIAVGVFSIQNIALSAALSIPFTDRPAGVRFAISERHKPFLVTVGLFGGGGFFGVGVSAKGLEQVEASIEFGGNVSLNLGVASGGVYVMAGVYYGMKGESVELTGYLRCGGHLEVLAILSISLEFYLAFTYRKKSGEGSEVWGQASLTVNVEVAFFSTSVTLSVERRFAGSGGDPTFAESVTPAAWARYLQAFA